MGFGQRLETVLTERDMTAADLSHKLGWNTGAISQYMNNPDRSPRLETALKIAKALNVSIDYLAGVVDQPTEYVRDPECRRLIAGFLKLPRKGKDEILSQLDYQLSKRTQQVPNSSVSGVA